MGQRGKRGTWSVAGEKTAGRGDRPHLSKGQSPNAPWYLCVPPPCQAFLFSALCLIFSLW